MPEFFGKNHSGGDNWTGQSAATSLIDAGDASDADGTQFFFIAKSAAPIHQFADYTDFRR